jgi:TrmH family RNA methyltransferase
MPEVITSSQNSTVKLIRSLHQKKGREESQLFLVEGIHPVGEAVEAGWELEALVYAPDTLKSSFAVGLVDGLLQRGLRCVALSAERFSDLTDKENPQGLLAVVRQRHLTLPAVSGEAFKFGAALVSPQDPGNVGTVLRTLDAVGADGLFLLEGGVELYHPSVVRASMGTLFWKPVIQASFDDFVHWAHQKGISLIGTSAHAAAEPGALERAKKPLILVFGSEQKGLSQKQLASCDTNVSLPMKGRVSSLNLAVAAGILLYQCME